MQWLYLYLIVSIWILGGGVSRGQDCTNYHVDNCRWADRTFLYSRQSRSAIFTPGMKSEFRIIVYGKEEYYISIDGHRKLGDIRLRVFEDNKKKSVLYDNANFNYEDFFYFKNSRTRDLVIEISTEEPRDPKAKENRYCLGVLIEFRDISPRDGQTKNKIGF